MPCSFISSLFIFQTYISVNNALKMTAGPGSFTKSLILDNYRGGDLNTISSNDKVYRLVSKSIQSEVKLPIQS
jgi:hypothetical protein